MSNDPKGVPSEIKEVLTSVEAPCSLVVWNDDVNTFEWVIDTLVQVCGHTEEQAEQCAYLVHFNGKCDVKKGDYEKAQSYIKTALQTDCKNPSLLAHVGLIYAKAGNKTSAKEYLQEALKNNPNISPLLKAEAEKVLHSI